MENAGTCISDDFHFALNGRMIVNMRVMDGRVYWKLNVELKQLQTFGTPHIHA
jgi:hypothetical protein